MGYWSFSRVWHYECHTASWSGWQLTTRRWMGAIWTRHPTTWLPATFLTAQGQLRQIEFWRSCGSSIFQSILASWSNCLETTYWRMYTPDKLSQFLALRTYREINCTKWSVLRLAVSQITSYAFLDWKKSIGVWLVLCTSKHPWKSASGVIYFWPRGLLSCSKKDHDKQY